MVNPPFAAIKGSGSAGLLLAATSPYDLSVIRSAPGQFVKASYLQSFRIIGFNDSRFSAIELSLLVF
jgi:hypothetical protein